MSYNEAKEDVSNVSMRAFAETCLNSKIRSEEDRLKPLIKLFTTTAQEREVIQQKLSSGNDKRQAREEHEKTQEFEKGIAAKRAAVA